MNNLIQNQCDKPHIQTFGRRKSRKISETRNFIIETILPKFSLEIEDVNNISKIFNEPKKVILEIGFGNGEHLIGKSLAQRENFFIGCEPFINGVANFLKQANEHENLQNVKVYNDDAFKLIEACKNEFFDEIYILFPDPWPKKKHNKRRIINQKFLEFLHSKLKINGKITIATDHQDYAHWMLEEFAKVEQIFKLNAEKDFHIEPQNWVKTKYQKKAEKLSLPIYFFHLNKVI